MPDLDYIRVRGRFAAMVGDTDASYSIYDGPGWRDVEHAPGGWAMRPQVQVDGEMRDVQPFLYAGGAEVPLTSSLWYPPYENRLVNGGFWVSSPLPALV